MNSIPTYRGAAVSFFYPGRINFCACKKEGNGLVEKDIEASWNEPVTKSALEKIVMGSLQLASLQGNEIFIDQVMPRTCYIPLAIGWPNGYKNPVLDSFKDLNFPDYVPRSDVIDEDIRFENLFRAIYHNHELNRGHFNMAALLIGRGVYLPNSIENELDKIYGSQVDNLEILFNSAKMGDANAIQSLSTVGLMVAIDRTDGVKKAFPNNYKRARFLDLNRPYQRFLNLPKVVEVMKKQIGEMLEIDPKFIRIKFPDDDKHDHFFDVVASEIEGNVAQVA